MREKHIVLLPKEDYWEWVRAAQKYVLAFNVNITPEPDTAGRHFSPGQMVTIANVPDGYPQQGDILKWFEQKYPGAKLDSIDVTSPDDLAGKLQTRVDTNDRYGGNVQIEGVLKLHWPTDYSKVTQPFGVNADIYGQFGESASQVI